MPFEQPLLQVSLGGAAVAGAVFVEVENLGYFNADRFRASFAIGAGTSVEFFAALGTVPISIDVSGGSGFANLITGQVDNIHIDLPRNVATVCGRDLAAGLIDAELSETFNNQTSSQIALTIAGRHGLVTNVTATNTAVGQYYELDHARSGLALNSRATTEWNLLCQLAQAEGFVLGVAGSTLNFGPAASGTPVLLNLQDMMILELDTATTIPGAATVKSWNSRNKMAITQTAGTNNGTTIVRPNLTAAQASTIAANHLASLAQHTTILTATMPGETSLQPSAQIALSGTNSVLDQNYTIDVIRRSLDARRGFVQTVRAFAVTG